MRIIGQKRPTELQRLVAEAEIRALPVRDARGNADGFVAEGWLSHRAGGGAGRMTRMDLPVAVSVLLIVAGLWNLIVWPQFLRRVIKDPRARDESGNATTFLTVHIVLVTVSLTLGVAVGVVGIAALV